MSKVTKRPHICVDADYVNEEGDVVERRMLLTPDSQAVAAALTRLRDSDPHAFEHAVVIFYSEDPRGTLRDVEVTRMSGEEWLEG